MPRSSRSKSHKQSKHSSKDVTKEYSENSEEDVKMKERNGKEEKEKENSVRVSRDSVSGEKRKLGSQSRDGKDLSGHGNGDVSDDYAALKRRKEKGDRWNGEEKGEELKAESSDKVLKSKESSKVVTVESKSKSSRRHDEKKEESSSEAKRKSEKESSGRKEGHKQYSDSKESKDKDRERKIQDGEVAKNQGEEQQSKKGRENTEWPVEEELRNPELEKELEKRIRRRGEGSGEKDKYQDDGRESDDRRLSIKGDRSKDVKHKDESHGDKYREDGERENRHREDKYRDDGDREIKSKDVKHREDGDRDNRHKDDKYREDGDRDNRHREDKYREDVSRDNRYKEDRYREDGDRDSRHRDDKYREVGDRDERNRDDKHRQDGDREYRHKEDKHRDDVDRDSRHRDGRPRDDTDREKRVRDAKYRDVHTSRDHNESETKRLRDESSAVDLHYRRSNNRDASPIYDDRVTRYKDDKDRRRGNDKEEPSDFRSRSTKEQRSDAEKRTMSSVKVDSGTDRGRPNSRNADMEVTVNHSRRRSSPSSSAYARDHYRVSKQEDSKYRDYAYDERVRHNVSSSRDFSSAPGQSDKISSSRSLEKITQKDDGYLGELSVERRLRSDVRSSPLVDKSPSSTSNDRRHLNRPDVRRSLDVEESGQRSGSSKEAKEYTGKDGKGSRDLPMEAHLVDDLSQADGDNLSVSSPYTRNNHFSGNSKSLLPPPPPFRSGGDSPSIFGGSEDDNRGKPNNRHRRMGDPNMGRAQSGWKGVPNWPSPLANGYMPFQHGPPPVGFHPVMQQFPPPMFGVRPSMKLNHTGLPYHIPDGDRFSSHGRPLGWRNPVDDSIPPPLHGWDANNALFGDESNFFGRMDWDHGRNQLSNRGWEPSDMWKGQNIGATMDLQSAPQKDDYSARRSADEIWSGQSGQHMENEQNQPDLQAESVNISQSIDALERNTPEAPKIPESPFLSKITREDDTHISQIYLSKVDISADLTQPDLYDQCSSMMDLDQTALSDEFDCKILFMEEAVEAKMKIPDSASLFAAINDSVFQKAMSLYKKQKEEFGAINGEKVSFSNADDLEVLPASDHEKAGSDDDDMPGEDAEAAASNVNQEREKLPVSNIQKLDEAVVTNNLEKTEEQISTSDKVEMEVDLVLPKQEESDFTVEEKSSPMESLALSCKVEEVTDEISKEEQNELVLETKCGRPGGGGGPLLFSDVSSEACEAVMPIECGSVYLSRIHHSPESTH